MSSLNGLSIMVKTCMHMHFSEQMAMDLFQWALSQYIILLYMKGRTDNYWARGPRCFSGLKPDPTYLHQLIHT